MSSLLAITAAASLAAAPMPDEVLASEGPNPVDERALYDPPADSDGEATTPDNVSAEDSAPDTDGAETAETLDIPSSSQAAATGSSEDAPPVAENVDLSEPVNTSEETAAETAPETPGDAEPQPDPHATDPLADAVAAGLVNRPIVLLDTTVQVATAARLSWSPAQSFEGIAAPTPVLVVNGAKPGPTVCLTAAVHGDELNGIEIVRRVLYDLDPERLSGAVIGVPIVNLQGFRRSSRYLPDRRDLNRFFPGNPTGSSASRIAHSFFTEVITHCDALVDLHTGSFHRTNLPQLRADLRNPQVANMTNKFGSTVVLHSSASKGTLRRAATDAGIPAVTLEAGEPLRVQDDAVDHGTRGIMTLLRELDMVRRVTFWGNREPVYYQSTWIRADQGGVLMSEVELGQRVKRGETLGTVTDPITNVQFDLVAKYDGRVLGKALNQFVMPGFAAFHLGIEESDHPIVITPDKDSDPGDQEFAEEEESSTFAEDTTHQPVDADDYLEDSE
ncbi:MAG: succinylglutamate desuccinylase/aspartoacylase family protein [Woeseiaceae bacterium]|nr:succinylglutamate desuccinylase/aspartoacylase family protein [Woeseiaceae bacterium]